MKSDYWQQRKQREQEHFKKITSWSASGKFNVPKSNVDKLRKDKNGKTQL